jgi:hypothetical protein
MPRGSCLLKQGSGPRPAQTRASNGDSIAERSAGRPLLARGAGRRRQSQSGPPPPSYAMICDMDDQTQRTGAAIAPMSRFSRGRSHRLVGDKPHPPAPADPLRQVASARVDAMINVARCRVVDAALAAPIVSGRKVAVRSEEGAGISLGLDQPTSPCGAWSRAVVDRLSACLAS